MNDALGKRGAWDLQRRQGENGKPARGLRHKAELRAGQGGILTLASKMSGAGEGIRTLDPNLGKVVLYP
jgi:hypothetical protein